MYVCMYTIVLQRTEVHLLRISIHFKQLIYNIIHAQYFKVIKYFPI